MAAKDCAALFKAWWGGDAKALTREAADILFGTVSYFDYGEDFCHAMVAGMFLGEGYEVRANSGQGTGRADVTIKERSRRRAIVIAISSIFMYTILSEWARGNCAAPVTEHKEA